MKRVKVYLGLACLMTLLCLKPQVVGARELNPFQTKMINPHTSYKIYQNLTRKVRQEVYALLIRLNMAMFKPVQLEKFATISIAMFG